MKIYLYAWLIFSYLFFSRNLLPLFLPGLIIVKASAFWYHLLSLFFFYSNKFRLVFFFFLLGWKTFFYFCTRSFLSKDSTHTMRQTHIHTHSFTRHSYKFIKYMAYRHNNKQQLAPFIILEWYFYCCCCTKSHRFLYFITEMKLNLWHCFFHSFSPSKKRS